MWLFKKRIDPVSVRLTNHDIDIEVLYQRTEQLQRFLQFELMDRIDKIDKRVTDLEKILKSCNITVTIIDKD